MVSIHPEPRILFSRIPGIRRSTNSIEVADDDHRFRNVGIRLSESVVVESEASGYLGNWAASIRSKLAIPWAASRYYRRLYLSLDNISKDLVSISAIMYTYVIVGVSIANHHKLQIKLQIWTLLVCGVDCWNISVLQWMAEAVIAIHSWICSQE